MRGNDKVDEGKYERGNMRRGEGSGGGGGLQEDVGNVTNHNSRK